MDLFHVIKNENKYWLVDQLDVDHVSEEEYKTEFKTIYNSWKEKKIGFLSLMIDDSYEEWLTKFNFKKITTFVNYYRELSQIGNVISKVKIYCLDDELIDENEFAQLYAECREGTANKNDQSEISDVMQSIKTELGPDWKKNCYYFKLKDEYVGISIPHIEIGKTDEGRLFYFGVMPTMRNQGLGKTIHKISLALLKNKFNATYYIGSTDTNNEHMIKIFEANNCELKNKKGVYKVEA